MPFFKRSSPPSPKLLHEPWRKIPSTERGDYLEYIDSFKPVKEDVEHIRIMLHGPAGSGKSSFINSVDTTLRRRMTGQALANSISGDSFTTKYKTYKIPQKSPGTFYPFVFTDIMGLEGAANRGVCVEDIKLAMKGHVKDGYVFNPQAKLNSTDRHYNSCPMVNDQTHVLVCIISASAVSLMTESFIQKMKEVRSAARDLDIPQIAILTKIDEACPEVQSDIGNVYKSKFVKKQMEELTQFLGIPLNCIFPVKNYHSEISRDENIELLILMALKQMIERGEDFVNNTVLPA